MARRPALWPLGSVKTGQAGYAGEIWHASIPNTLPRSCSVPLPVWPADPPGLRPQSPRALRAGAVSPTLPFLGPNWVSPVDDVNAQQMVSGAAARQAWLNDVLQEQLGGARLEAGVDRWEHPAEWAHPRFVRSYYLPGSGEYFDALHPNDGSRCGGGSSRSDHNVPSAADQPFASGALPAHRQQSDPGLSSAPDFYAGYTPNPDKGKASSSDVNKERLQSSLGNHLAESSDPATRRNIIPGLPVMFDDLPQDGKWKLLGKLTKDTTYAYKRTDDKEYLVMVNDGPEKDRLWRHLKNTLNYEPDDNDKEDRRNHARNDLSKAEKNQVLSNVDCMPKLREQHSGPARRQSENDAPDQKAKVQEQGTGAARRQRTREEMLKML